MNPISARFLGTAYRWKPCVVCGSRESQRVEITLDGERVVCLRVAACDARARRMPVRRATIRALTSARQRA